MGREWRADSRECSADSREQGRENRECVADGRDIGERRSIFKLYKVHQIKRRRLYDVLNVLAAIGFVTKVPGEEIQCNGRNQILPKMLQQKRSFQIDKFSISLTKLFPPEHSVRLDSLTVTFLLLFPALQVEVIDLHGAGHFFSRGSAKYRTTMKKLSQITLILNASGVTGKTANASEIRILPPFTKLLTIERNPAVDNPLAIERLLNRPIDLAVQIDARRAEYQKYWTMLKCPDETNLKSLVGVGNREAVK
jgi:hypothetical protein